MAKRENLFERARDELFSHINRCGVLEASEEDQRQWMDETLEFIAERYPDLTREQLNELKVLGLRFCQPAIAHGSESTALTRDGANAA
ncbi:MAG: hypothetical protein HY704_09980 [Gemmatimonadetes bacterium]|nr:hypothetical protein [Gemmatimonadota bacterium]